uniref:Uncharacterized protein n=1 Tax=Anopheles christyi TaxID=43041 RepID=A0A182JWK2_9DIPT
MPRPLMYDMGKLGHNVIMFSAHIEKSLPTNVSYVHLENFYSNMYNTSMRDTLNFFELPIESPTKMDVFRLNIHQIGLHFLLGYRKYFKFNLYLSDYIIGFSPQWKDCLNIVSCFESDESMLPITVHLYIRAWMSQNDLLAHPNIKLFTTHSN